MSYANWMEHHSGKFSRGHKKPAGEPTFITTNGLPFHLTGDDFVVDKYAVVMGLCRPFYHGSIPQISCFGRNFLVAAYLDAQDANLATCASALLSGGSFAYLGIDEQSAAFYELAGLAECVGYTELLIEDVMLEGIGCESDDIDSMLVKYSSECVTKTIFERFAPKLLEAMDFSDVVSPQWENVLQLDNNTDLVDVHGYKLSSMAMLYYTHLASDQDEQLMPIEFFFKMKNMLIDYSEGEENVY